jgi:hypothetical protein
VSINDWAELDGDGQYPPGTPVVRSKQSDPANSSGAGTIARSHRAGGSAIRPRAAGRITLEDSFSGVYVRGRMHEGPREWAVMAISSGEGAAAPK